MEPLRIQPSSPAEAGYRPHDKRVSAWRGFQACLLPIRSPRRNSDGARLARIGIGFLDANLHMGWSASSHGPVASGSQSSNSPVSGKEEERRLSSTSQTPTESMTRTLWSSDYEASRGHLRAPRGSHPRDSRLRTGRQGIERTPLQPEHHRGPQGQESRHDG